MSGWMAPEVPRRTSVSCRFCAFSCRVAKSTLASASSSVTEMSMLPMPMPVERTVMRFPL